MGSLDTTIERLGVYISVPFCRAKCSFCNFASGVSSPAVVECYVEQLCEEIAAARAASRAMCAELPSEVDTVYFGGGTPSLLAPEQLRRIFEALRSEFTVASDAEITLESAPSQISDALLDEAMRLGVDRVSLGVQSFVDRESEAVGRTHTERECVREIARLQAAGLAEVGADLIAGLPYQTPESWAHSLGVATSVGLTHLSVYMLEIDEDSRLGREVMAGGKRFHAHGVASDEASADMYVQACETLPRAGFAQYEISNFALGSAGVRTHQSRHNRKYWERRPYIGFGLDAHSMLRRADDTVRFANPDEMKEYAGAGSSREVTRVGREQAFEEALFLVLRMNEGVAIEELRETFGRERVEVVSAIAEELAGEGMMAVEDGRWSLTLRGRLVSNDVFGRLLEGELVA